MFVRWGTVALQAGGFTALLERYEVAISVVVALGVVLLTKVADGYFSRRRHRRALLAEVRSMPFRDLHNYAVFAGWSPSDGGAEGDGTDGATDRSDAAAERRGETGAEGSGGPPSPSDEEIDELRADLYPTDLLERMSNEQLRSCLATRRYFSQYLLAYRASFPGSVYDSVIGGMAFDEETTERLIAFYGHVRAGETLFGPEHLWEIADVAPETPVLQCAERPSVVVFAEDFARQGADLQAKLIKQLELDWVTRRLAAWERRLERRRAEQTESTVPNNG